MADTEVLLDQVSSGNSAAIAELLDRHRRRLRGAVGIWIDPRVAARFDASDVVQETLVMASKRLPSYARERPIPFYPWLRQLAWDQLIRYHRLHIHSQKRSVDREAALWAHLSNRSTAPIAKRLISSGTSPEEKVSRRESETRVREALDQLSATDRKVLVLLFLEQLSTGEVASILSLSPSAVGMRQLRALRKLKSVLNR